MKVTYHWSFNISRQIAPVTELIFGCHIFVSKFTLGGLNGYVSGILIVNLKTPPINQRQSFISHSFKL